MNAKHDSVSGKGREGWERKDPAICIFHSYKWIHKLKVSVLSLEAVWNKSKD